MRYETGTFELRDNDMMMRELSSAETDEVVGGAGTAEVAVETASGAGSTLTAAGLFRWPLAHTTASANINALFAATGPTNLIRIGVAQQSFRRCKRRLNPREGRPKAALPGICFSDKID